MKTNLEQLRGLYELNQVICGPNDLGFTVMNNEVLYINDFIAMVNKFKFTKHVTLTTIITEVLNGFYDRVNISNYKYVFNVPIFTQKEPIYISGKNTVIEDSNNVMAYGTLNNLTSYLLGKPWVRFVLLVKIVTGGFFLHEALEIYGLKSQLSVDVNVFFNNYEEFQKFISSYDLKINLPLYHNQEPLKYALEMIPIDLTAPITLDFIIQTSLTFGYKARLYGPNNSINCDSYYTPALKYSIPTNNIKRKLVLDGTDYAKYGDPYVFYMSKYMGLKYKSILSIQRKKIEEFLILNKSIVDEYWFSETLNDFLLKIKEKLMNHGLIINNIPVFIAVTNGSITHMKRIGRSQGYKQIYIINISGFVLELVNLKPAIKRAFIVLNY